MQELLSGLPGFDPVAVGGQTLRPQDYFYSGLLLVGVLGQYMSGKLTDRIRVEYGITGAFGVLTVLAVVFIPIAELGPSYLGVVDILLGLFLFIV